MSTIRLLMSLPDPGFAARIVYGDAMENLLRSLQVEPPKKKGTTYVYLLDVKDGVQQTFKIAGSSVGIGAREGQVLLVVSAELGRKMKEAWAEAIKKGTLRVVEEEIDGKMGMGFLWKGTPGPLFSRDIVGGRLTVEVIQSL